jgi:fructosamine-3-kinase
VGATEPFCKRDPAAPPGFFAAEARGLRWLAAAPGGVPTVAVRAVGVDRIELDRLAVTRPTQAQAVDFGCRLAATHRAGAPVWGHPDGDGFIGPLDLPNGPFGSCAELWWSGRVEPYLRAAVDRGLLARSEASTTEAAVDAALRAVPDEPPSRLHGDLWSGNVVWTPDGAVLVDAGAAHGGNREADLAMLALFGLPYLADVLAAYDEQWPLEPGWQHRVRLWQLHPLLVHVVLFGAGYVERTREAVRVVRRM